MNEVLRPDLCVLGGGSGGQSLAAGAAAWGLSVALVESQTLAGEGPGRAAAAGAFLSAGRIVKTLRDGPSFGVLADGKRIDFRCIAERAERLAAELAGNYSRARLEAMNIRVIAGTGRFTRPNTLEAGGHTIRARRFVIATGTVERLPAIPGLDLIHPLTCASLIKMDSLPPRLIVIGGDPQGLALAQALRRLGSEVVVVTNGALFPDFDEVFSEPVRIQLLADGIDLREGVQVVRIEPHGDGLRAFVLGAGAEHSIEGSHLMIAAGAAPVVEGLGLEAARVRYSAAGVEVGANLRSSNRRIFAIGAAARVRQGSGASTFHAAVVLRAILGLPAQKIAAGGFAEVIMTDPPIAAAGLSEAEARARHGHIRIFRFPFRETDWGRIANASGHLKLITSKNGAVLGAAMVGTAAEELINSLTLAISKGVNATTLATLMIPYPSLADAVRKASWGFAAQRRSNPAIRLFLRFMRKIG
jgi:pyruvate/2-oxoglutarate dehydrogenase complex dihydrolipoamide dehydrogenase (E3) component